eukprot:COSAG01_NODE_10495_length_2151_cov_6.033138_1_plen_35_part_10
MQCANVAGAAAAQNQLVGGQVSQAQQQLLHADQAA